jgi:ribosomal protein L17
MPNKYHTWSETQIEQLTRQYPWRATKKIADDLGIPLEKVQRKAFAMNLRKASNNGSAFRIPRTKGHEAAKARRKALKEAFAENDVTHHGIENIVWEHINQNKHSIEYLIKKAKAQPAYRRRHHVDKNTKKKETRIVFQPNPNDPRPRPVQLLEWVFERDLNVRSVSRRGYWDRIITAKNKGTGSPAVSPRT